MRDVRIEVARGGEVTRHLGALAGLRLQVFREWPYLYEGDAAYEEAYLRTYAGSPGAMVVLALDAGRVVGASTGLPLAAGPEEVRAPFAAAGIEIGSVFYFGESVLLPEYRGRGIGGKFMDAREAEARATGHRWAAFCAVERDARDARRPEGSGSLHGFWQKRGFVRREALRTEFSWREIGEAAESPKPMVFWTKEIGKTS